MFGITAQTTTAQLGKLELWGEEDRLQPGYPISNHFIHQFKAGHRSWVLSNWQRESEEAGEWLSAVMKRKHELSIQAVGGLVPDGVNYITCTQSMWLELREEENLPRLIIQTLLFWPTMLSWSSQCLCEWICSHMKREKQGEKWCWCPLGASGGECRSASTCAAAPTLTDTHVWHTYVHPNSIIHVLPSPKVNTQLRLNCTYCIDKC